MFDITNEQSFMSIRPWLDQLRVHSNLDNPDMVLCGNKVDMEHRRVISWSRANNEAIKHGIPYFETSAATGLNVSKAIEALLELVLIRMHKVIELSVPKMLTPSDKKKHSRFSKSFKLHERTDGLDSLQSSNSTSSSKFNYCSCR